MAIIQSIPNSLKYGIITGLFDFSSDAFKIALYDESAELGPFTTAYTATGEVSSAGYVAGGTSVTPTLSQSGNYTLVDFANVTWTDPSLSITARGAIIYDDTSPLDSAVCVLDFGFTITKATTFTVKFPPSGETTSLIRVI